MAGETNNKEFQELMTAIKGLTTAFNSRSSAGAGGAVEKSAGQKQTAQFEKDLTESVKYFGKGIIGAFSKMKTNIEKDFDQIKADTFSDILISNQKRTGSEMAAQTNAVMKGAIVLIRDSAKTAATAFAGAMLQFNKLWNAMMGGIEDAMKGMKDMAFKALEGVGIGGGPIAGALSGLLDGFIKGIMFKFEDALKQREMKRAVTMQFGTNAPEAAAFSRHMVGYYNLLGRQVSTEFAEAFSGIGVVNDKVADDMIGIATNLKMGAGEATQLLEKYMTYGNSAARATDQIQANFRKLQAAAQESGLPVKMMAGYIAQASTNARFLNVDVALVGNTMANLQKKTKDLSNLGVDFRIHGASIMNDLATGGKNVSDAMHVFYGSKGGVLDMSVGAAWAKSMFGEKTAGSLSKTAEGGFTTGGMGLGEASQGNTMMIQRLELMKQTMMDASAGASDDAEALFLQMKAAKDVFGLSDEAARTVAASGKDEIKKLADNPAMAAQMKDTKTILGEMQTVATKSEALQRHLVNLNMAIVKILFEIPILIIGWFKTTWLGDGDDTLYKSSLAALDKQGGEFKQAAVGAGKVLDSVAANDMAYFGGRIDAVTNAMGKPETVKSNYTEKTLAREAEARKAIEAKGKRAEGGPVSSGELYQVGENNRPELLMIPGNRGEVISSDKVDKLAAAGAAGSAGASGSGGIHINLAVHGVTKDQIMQQITNEVLRALQ